MKIRREELEDIVRKVIRELERDLVHENYYIVISSPWSNLYYLALEELKSSKKPFTLLLSNNIAENRKIEVHNYLDWNKIYEFQDDDHIAFPPGKFLFLSLNRNDIIDVAQLKANKFETRLIKDRISYGEEIYYWKKGLEKVTGKEPETYKRKLLSYYEEIFQFGVIPVEIEVVKK